jgi:homogentisate 1,2-dioxygenase
MSFLLQIISQETIIKLIPKYGLIIEINDKGEIIRSLHDPSAEKVPSASEVEDKDGVLYFLAFFLTRLILP